MDAPPMCASIHWYHISGGQLNRICEDPVINCIPLPNHSTSGKDSKKFTVVYEGNKNMVYNSKTLGKVH